MYMDRVLCLAKLNDQAYGPLCRQNYSRNDYCIFVHHRQELHILYWRAAKDAKSTFLALLSKFAWAHFTFRHGGNCVLTYDDYARNHESPP